MKKQNDPTLTRREFARASALTVAAAGAVAAGLVPGRAAAEEEKLVTEVPAAATLVSSLGYVNESPKPDQRCSNCALYSGPAEGKGKCAVFQQGAVAAKGWCQSWAPKPA